MCRRFLALGRGAVLLGTLSGCATTKAADAVVIPELAPPDAPPRIVAEYEPDPPLPAEPVSPDAVSPPPRAPRQPRRDVPRPEPVDESPVASTPAPAAPPPSLTLQTSASSAQADQSIRTLLARAARDLGRVSYQSLDADGRTQYDTARRFMQQADDALKARNVMFAGKLADKAATMAAVLVR